MTPTFMLGMILLQCSVVGNPMDCTRGEKLHTSKEGHDICIICPRGTFMPEEHHIYRQCYGCTRIENSTLEVEITKCNGTHDAVIDCKCGYYRYMPRTKDEKEECKQCPDCHVPVVITGYYRTTSSYQSSGPESTTLLGVTEDAENRARGTSVSTDTLHSHEQNKTNHSQNGVTECQTRVLADLCLYGAVFAMLVSTFVTFVRMNKPDTIVPMDKPDTIVPMDTPDTKHDLRSGACSRFTTQRIMIAAGFLVLLFVLLLICALLKAGAIAAPHYVSDVCHVITVSAAVVYVITVNIFTRRQNKPQVNEEIRLSAVVASELESMIHGKTNTLRQVLDSD